MSVNSQRRTLARTQAREGNLALIDPYGRAARDAIRLQAKSIEAMARRVDERFGRAIRVLYATEGHVIISGVGKSGLIGKKIAATLASTGTPSFFLHSGEAAHGDLGMVTRRDTVILISNSGRTAEVLRMLPHLQERDIPTIALVGDMDSPLAVQADISLDVSVERELCPNNLAPTNSTLATLAMGDVISVTLSRLHGFHSDDFARLHLGGGLGARLRKVSDVMLRDRLPCLSPTTPARDALAALARQPVPFVAVIDEGRLVGTVSARALAELLEDPAGALDIPLCAMMRLDPPVIHPDALLVDARELMLQAQQEAIIVADARGHVVGVVTIVGE